jgi:hypothetical protein
MYTSRFSFRIVCQRDSPHKAFLYAAVRKKHVLKISLRVFDNLGSFQGFNGENEIFLGSGAITDSLPDGSTEGFVTNGVFVTFPGENPSWYEVGTMSNKLYFYSKRNQKRTRTELNNELLSGSIIAIGGENFLWLNPEDFDTLNPTWNLRDWFNDQESYCPITLSRVKFGYGTQGNAAHVYPGCGHVHGDLLGNICKCWCGEKGPIQILKYPCPSVLEITAPTHCFNPCGCAVSEETAKFWSNKTLLRTRAQSINHSPFQTCCPWCKTVCFHFSLLFQRTLSDQKVLFSHYAQIIPTRFCGLRGLVHCAKNVRAFAVLNERFPIHVKLNSPKVWTLIRNICSQPTLNVKSV